MEIFWIKREEETGERSELGPHWRRRRDFLWGSFGVSSKNAMRNERENEKIILNETISRGP